MFFTKLKFFKQHFIPFVFSLLFGSLRKGNHAEFTEQKECPFKGCDFYGTLSSFITLITLSKSCWAVQCFTTSSKGRTHCLVLGEISLKGNLVYIGSAATWHLLLVFVAYTYCLLEHELNPVKHWFSALGWLF